MSTRREFFKRAAAMSGGAGLASLLLESVQRASAIDPPAGSTYLDAEHIVILMQENRSFDHAFGRLRGVRGFNDPRAVTLPDHNSVWLQSNAAGETYAPFRLDIKNTKATWLGSLPHSWTDQTDARNHGNHDGWLDHKPSGHKDCKGMPLTMGFYDREDIPFYYALADAFTVCDQHFCSSLTGTTPNRLYLWTGTVREKPDPAALPAVRNSEVDYGAMVRWKTFPERLEEAGISWKIYQNELSLDTGFNDDQDAWLANFTDNPIEWFEQFNVRFLRTYRAQLLQLEEKLPGMIEQLRNEVAATGDAAKKKRLEADEALLARVKADRAKWTEANFEKLSAHQRNLYTKAFTTNAGDPFYRQLDTLTYPDGAESREMTIPKGDVLYQFREDVQMGKLPAVSWLVAPERFSDHPGAPWYGAWYVAEALDILTRNPDVWKKTIFILTYDENDGYFDHVPPFVAPDPKNPASGKTSPGIDAAADYLQRDLDETRQPAAEARGGPIGLGYRVPMVIASPWSRGGFVCSQVFDHTSPLQFMEKVLSHRHGKRIVESNITSWRRTVSGDLTSAFRAYQSSPDVTVPFPPRKEFLEGVNRAQYKPLPNGYRKLSVDDVQEFARDRFASQWMPRQEEGVRPSCALPYELSAEGAVNGQSFELTLEARNSRLGKAAAGSPFHVYTPGLFGGDAKLRTRAYAVAAGQRVSDGWDLAGFENGVYHLCVHGPNGFFRELRGAAADPQVEVRCEYSRESAGDVELRVSARSACTIQVADVSYKNGRQSMELAAGGEKSIALPLSASHQWYDFSVTVEGNDKFLRRYAGRVETGKSGFSDPAMGRMKS